MGQITVTSFEDTTVSAWRGEAEVTRPGSIAVRGDSLDRFLKLSSKADKILQLETFDVDNSSSLRIITSRGAHEFDGYPEAVFESVDPGRANVDLGDISVLASAMKIAKTAAASETEVVGARVSLSGIHIRPNENDFHVVGTDGKRMAWSSIHCQGLMQADIPEEGITIPGKMIATVSNLIASEPAAIRVVDNSLIVENGGGSISFPLLDAAFPDYTGLLKVECEHCLTVPSKDFAMALDRSSASIGQEDRFVTATLLRDADGVHLSSFTSQESSSEILADQGGEECDISFNVSFMKRAAANIEARHLDIHFTDVSRPMLLSSKDRPDLLMLVMPCKSNGSR
jgi:DNA polymerase III sliding clamp (beta) subunit (PCNA family)